MFPGPPAQAHASVSLASPVSASKSSIHTQPANYAPRCASMHASRGHPTKHPCLRACMRTSNQAPMRASMHACVHPIKHQCVRAGRHAAQGQATARCAACCSRAVCGGVAGAAAFKQPAACRIFWRSRAGRQRAVRCGCLVAAAGGVCAGDGVMVCALGLMP
eukprot:366082-Chlamydomonas_euryale.AAC.4